MILTRVGSIKCRKCARMIKERSEAKIWTATEAEPDLRKYLGGQFQIGRILVVS